MRLDEIKKTNGQFFTTREEIEQWLDKVGVHRYTINDDLTVDVDGDVYLLGVDLKYVLSDKLRHLPVQFNKVAGDFYISSNNELKTLIGCPVEVGRSFACSDCDDLITLEGAPKHVGGSFYANNCMLSSLTGAPLTVGTDFRIGGCKKLKSLKGLPDRVNNLDCSNMTELSTLEGCPELVNDTLYLNGCTSLKSFDHLPKRARQILARNAITVRNCLSLLRVEDLRYVMLPNEDVNAIISKYLPEGNIFECQNELIEAGFEEYAEL